MPEITLDFTPRIIEQGFFPRTKAVRRFLSKLGEAPTSRSLRCSWLGGEALAIDMSWTRESLQSLQAFQLAQPGDQLFISIRSDAKVGSAELRDGSAVFVLHVLERADAWVLESVLPFVPARDPVIRSPEQPLRKSWAEAVRVTTAVMAGTEVFGLNALHGLQDYLAHENVELAIAGDNGPVAAERVFAALSRWPASGLLREVLRGVESLQLAQDADPQDSVSPITPTQFDALLAFERERRPSARREGEP